MNMRFILLLLLFKMSIVSCKKEQSPEPIPSLKDNEYLVDIIDWTLDKDTIKHKYYFKFFHKDLDLENCAYDIEYRHITIDGEIIGRLVVLEDAGKFCTDVTTMEQQLRIVEIGEGEYSKILTRGQSPIWKLENKVTADNTILDPDFKCMECEK